MSADQALARWTRAAIWGLLVEARARMECAMGRDVSPLYVADLSAFSKQLRGALAGQEGLPGHQGMMDLVAKAAGFRNLQQFQAGRPNLEAPRRDVLRLFDETGRFVRWPSKTSQQRLALWVIWSRMPPRVSMDERAVSAFLAEQADGVDAAQMRRGLIEHGLAVRRRDGSAYLRVEQEPEREALALIKRLGPLR